MGGGGGAEGAIHIYWAHVDRENEREGERERDKGVRSAVPGRATET